MSKQGIVKINFLEKITSARWQDKKPRTFYRHAHQFNNNTGTNFLCGKARSQLRGSCTPRECANSHIIVGRKAWHTLSPKSLRRWEMGGIPSPSFSLGREGKGRTGPYLWHLDFSGLPKGLFLSCLNQCGDGNSQGVSGWESLRTKAVIGTSTQFLHVCLSSVLAYNFLF